MIQQFYFLQALFLRSASQYIAKLSSVTNTSMIKSHKNSANHKNYATIKLSKLTNINCQYFY